jgi:hypothetical protein
MGETAPTTSRARTLVRVGIIIALLGSAGVAVFQAQTAASQTLHERAGPYLDAIIGGDHVGAAALDHPSRAPAPDVLKAAYDARAATFGRPAAWSIVNTNAGRDPDGELVLGTIHLTHDGREDPVPLRIELRDDGGAMKVSSVRPTSQALLKETVW